LTYLLMIIDYMCDSLADKIDDALTVCFCFLFPLFCVLFSLQYSSVHEVNFVVFFRPQWPDCDHSQTVWPWCTLKVTSQSMVGHGMVGFQSCVHELP
jgi:hypothetical protein